MWIKIHSSNSLKSSVSISLLCCFVKICAILDDFCSCNVFSMRIEGARNYHYPDFEGRVNLLMGKR